MDVPNAVVVVIEVPRGGFVKRRADGRVAFVSPIPCPFNYGSVPGTLGADGDPVDAVVLGPSLPRGGVATWAVHGVVPFSDRGVDDPKLVCGDRPPTDREWRWIRRFFLVYGVVKRVARL